MEQQQGEQRRPRVFGDQSLTHTHARTHARTRLHQTRWGRRGGGGGGGSCFNYFHAQHGRGHDNVETEAAVESGMTAGQHEQGWVQKLPRSATPQRFVWPSWTWSRNLTRYRRDSSSEVAILLFALSVAFSFVIKNQDLLSYWR